MKFINLLVIFLFINVVSAADTDRELFNKIVGKWLFEAVINDVSITATEQYMQDGVIHTHGKVFVDGELVEEYTAKSTWEVVGGYSNVEIIESTSKNLPPGLKISDEIISVDENQFTFESQDGKQTTIFRVK